METSVVQHVDGYKGRCRLAERWVSRWLQTERDLAGGILALAVSHAISELEKD